MPDIEFPFLQAAGVTSLEEAELIAECGFNYLGIPLRLDIHKPDLSEKHAKQLVSNVTGLIKPVLITYISDAGEIIELADFLNIRVIQLHGSVNPFEVEKIKVYRPDLTIIKSIIIGDSLKFNPFNSLIKYSAIVDAFITDTYDKMTGTSGATGKTHNWGISREIVLSTNIPVMLAGGLTPENISEAISFVQPWGVDSHTGLEDFYGRKNQLKMLSFVRNAKAAFAEAGHEVNI